MGISGLLKQLRSIAVKTHLKDFKGKKVAIDGHCWIHRGAFSCSKDLARGVNSFQLVTFFLNMIDMLFSHGVVDVIVVFDGGSLPVKRATNDKRSGDRLRNLLLAVVAESIGDSNTSNSCYQQSVSVSPEMIRDLVRVLSDKGIQCIIAPYEADAQLAYLSQLNNVDVVITEDSDSLVYGCKKVLFKLNRDGTGDLIDRRQLCYNRGLSFANWSDDQFKLFCCMCGCDDVPNLKSIGLKTAYKIVNKFKTLTRVLEFLKTSPKFHRDLTSEYPQQLQRALMTFKHQTIYNFDKGCMEPLTPLPHYSTSLNGVVQRGMTEDVQFLGPRYDSQTSRAIVNGAINPVTLKPFDSQACNAGAVLYRRVKELVERMSFEEKVSLLQNPAEHRVKTLLAHLIQSEPGASSVARINGESVKHDRQVVDWSFHRSGGHQETEQWCNTETRGPMHDTQFLSRETIECELDQVGEKRKIPRRVDKTENRAQPNSSLRIDIAMNAPVLDATAGAAAAGGVPLFQSTKVAPAFMTMRRRSVTINRVTDGHGVSTTDAVAPSCVMMRPAVASKVPTTAFKSNRSPITVRTPELRSPEVKGVRVDQAPNDEPFFTYDCDVAVHPPVSYSPFFFDHDSVDRLMVECYDHQSQSKRVKTERSFFQNE